LEEGGNQIKRGERVDSKEQRIQEVGAKRGEYKKQSRNQDESERGGKM